MEEKKKNHSEKHVKAIGGNVVKNAIDATNKGNNAAKIRLALGILAIVIYLGNDIAKLLLRKNFTVSIIELIRYSIVVLLFLSCGAVSIFWFIYALFGAYDTLVWTDYLLKAMSFSFLATGVIYTCLAFYLLKKVINLRKLTVKNNPSVCADGEIELFQFLKEHDWSEKKIKYLGEPSYLIILAFLSVFANVLGGIPLIYAAISIWLYRLLELMFPIAFLPEPVNKPIQQEPQFYQVS